VNTGSPPLDSGDEFSPAILVKVNFADVLRRELIRRGRGQNPIGFVSATDP